MAVLGAHGVIGGHQAVDQNRLAGRRCGDGRSSCRAADGTCSILDRHPNVLGSRNPTLRRREVPAIRSSPRAKDGEAARATSGSSGSSGMLSFWALEFGDRAAAFRSGCGGQVDRCSNSSRLQQVRGSVSARRSIRVSSRRRGDRRDLVRSRAPMVGLASYRA
jgi:hypothetical protein